MRTWKTHVEKDERAELEMLQRKIERAKIELITLRGRRAKIQNRATKRRVRQVG